MAWYIPFTIIPGVGLIILSTSNIILNLNDEISRLEGLEKEKLHPIIEAKLRQLKSLSWAIIYQYCGLFAFMLSGIIAALVADFPDLSKYILLLGGLFVTLSLYLLIIYSFKAVKIRQKHLTI